MTVNVTVHVAVILLLCLEIFPYTQSAYPGCTHNRTGERGQIWSVTDVTSDHCEWDIATDEDRVILINFDTSGFRRGSENCTSDVLTFHDGDSPVSRVTDTFCGDQTSDDVGRLHLSTASTGNRMHVIYSSGPVATQGTEFNITFTTRDNMYVPDFNEETFLPQTKPVFNHNTAKDFVQVELIYTLGGVDIPAYPRDHPYGYTTFSKTADTLELYVTYPDYIITDSALGSSTYDCIYVFDGSPVPFPGVYMTVPGDRDWAPDDWPWVPFENYDQLNFERTEGVVKYTFSDVKVGEENANQNTVRCKIQIVQLTTKLSVTACPIGRFGRFCAERCQCFNGASCHSFNGACRCAPGWRGRNCTIVSPLRIESPTSELTDLRYGQELQLRCIGHEIHVHNVTWIFENDQTPDVTMTGSSSDFSLRFKSFLPVHEGLVICEAFDTSEDKYTAAEDIRIAGVL